MARRERRASLGGQVALQFDAIGSGDMRASDLSHRSVWGPAVDQLLPDE